MVFPTQGQQAPDFWDGDLKAYIDAAPALATDARFDAVEADVASADSRLDGFDLLVGSGRLSETAIGTTVEDIITDSGVLPETYVVTTSPMAYGAVGDNTADDTTALQAAITAAANFGLVLDLRGKTYRTSNDLTVPANSTITNGSIRCTVTAKRTLNVTGSNVTLSRLNIIGRHATPTYAVSEFGIYADGPSASSFITGLVIDRVSITGMGDWGIVLRFVDGFRVTRCDLKNIGYMGIGSRSARNGLIDLCSVDMVLAGGAGTDAYGIALSRDGEVASFVTAPKVENVVISRNRISNIMHWEGIDTHGGERITVVDNIVTGCKIGISMVGDDAEGQVTTYAPKQVIVKGNIVDSLRNDGLAGPGIQLCGAQATSGLGTDPARDYATGTIVGNTVRGHGTQSDTISGALYFRNTLGLVVSGNFIDQPSPTAICLYYDNRGFSITGNTVLDAWSNATTFVSMVSVRHANNIGIIDGNALRLTGFKVATNLNKYGLYADGQPTTDINWGINSAYASVAAISSGSSGVFAYSQADLVPLKQVYGKDGTQTSPTYSFLSDGGLGMYRSGVGQIGFTVGGVLRARFMSTEFSLEDGMNISVGAGTGTMLGLGAAQKIGFWGATPVVRPAANPNTSGATLAALETEVNELKQLLRTIGLLTP